MSNPPYFIDQVAKVCRPISAYIARDVAREMAPSKTGDLEISIDVEEGRDIRRRKTFEIGTVGVEYAGYMHEGSYNLGPGSQAKQGGARFRIGRKFLSRALQYIRDDYDFVGRANRAVKNALGKSVR